MQYVHTAYEWIPYGGQDLSRIIVPCAHCAAGVGCAYYVHESIFRTTQNVCCAKTDWVVRWSSFHVKRMCLFQTIWMLGCTYCVDVLLAGFCPDARHLWSRCQKAFQKDHHHYHQTQKNLFTLINKISSIAMLVVVREEIKIKWRITGWESFEVSSLKRLFTIWLVAGFTTLVGI